jgi:S-adenosylmethionine synthetase
MFQFQLENLFRNTLKELGVSVPSGYYKVAEKITDRLSLPNRKHTIRRLNIIAYIRNSLHNNGIHEAFNKKDTIIQVDKIPFSFKHLKTVNCATWDHISHAWNGLLPVIRRIYFHSDVACLVNIPNQYVGGGP